MFLDMTPMGGPSSQTNITLLKEIKHLNSKLELQKHIQIYPNCPLVLFVRPGEVHVKVEASLLFKTCIL